MSTDEVDLLFTAAIKTLLYIVYVILMSDLVNNTNRKWAAFQPFKEGGRLNNEYNNCAIVIPLLTVKNKTPVLEAQFKTQLISNILYMYYIMQCSLKLLLLMILM